MSIKYENAKQEIEDAVEGLSPTEIKALFKAVTAEAEKQSKLKTYRGMTYKIRVERAKVEIRARDMPEARDLLRKGQGREVLTWDEPDHYFTERIVGDIEDVTE